MSEMLRRCVVCWGGGCQGTGWRWRGKKKLVGVSCRQAEAGTPRDLSPAPALSPARMRKGHTKVWPKMGGRKGHQIFNLPLVYCTLVSFFFSQVQGDREGEKRQIVFLTMLPSLTPADAAGVAV